MAPVSWLMFFACGSFVTASAKDGLIPDAVWALDYNICHATAADTRFVPLNGTAIAVGKTLVELTFVQAVFIHACTVGYVIVSIFGLIVLISLFSVYLNIRKFFQRQALEIAETKTDVPFVDPVAEWVLFEEVYDLTPFLAVHPGGAAVLQQCQGSDCTALFASYHTMRTPYLGMLKRFHVRRATQNEAIMSDYFEWNHTPKYDAMRAAVREHFKGGKSCKAPTFILVWYAVWFALLFWSTWRWLVAGEMVAAVVMGFSMWYAAHDMVHQAAHISVFASPTLNHWAANLSGFWIINTPAWIRQHNFLHHAFTNLEEDPDLHHFHFWYDELANFFEAIVGFFPMSAWRLTEQTPFRNAYMHWSLSVPFYMCYSTLALTILEPIYCFVTRSFMDHGPRLVFAPGELPLGWAQVVTVSSALLYVTAVHGVVPAMVPYTVEGIIFYLATQASHVNEDSYVGERNEDVKEEWAIHQLNTTHGDYAYDNWIPLMLGQGLNLQSIHHVFPAVHWAHYPLIYRKVWAAAGQTRESKSYAQIVGEHLKFVNKMNVPVGMTDMAVASEQSAHN